MDWVTNNHSLTIILDFQQFRACNIVSLDSKLNIGLAFIDAIDSVHNDTTPRKRCFQKASVKRKLQHRRLVVEQSFANASP